MMGGISELSPISLMSRLVILLCVGLGGGSLCFLGLGRLLCSCSEWKVYPCGCVCRLMMKVGCVFI